ncbi:hypothetical protein EJ04DRAFT_552715 [Polyplosphaeria fusca]|uniref:Uncharacterized protein n=1 Tax=Polyplosphaeria fusca TaxID=682080 RepID=A0A9P4V2N3_9PLEO|nr:hypothetical protein EJ04DRAFT_552715 [Polyplosphaeria fusca]
MPSGARRTSRQHVSQPAGAQGTATRTSAPRRPVCNWEEEDESLTYCVPVRGYVAPSHEWVGAGWGARDAGRRGAWVPRAGRATLTDSTEGGDGSGGDRGTVDRGRDEQQCERRCGEARSQSAPRQFDDHLYGPAPPCPPVSTPRLRPAASPLTTCSTLSKVHLAGDGFSLLGLLLAMSRVLKLPFSDAAMHVVCALSIAGCATRCARCEAECHNASPKPGCGPACGMLRLPRGTSHGHDVDVTCATAHLGPGLGTCTGALLQMGWTRLDGVFKHHRYHPLSTILNNPLLLPAALLPLCTCQTLQVAP